MINSLIVLSQLLIQVEAYATLYMIHSMQL